MNRTSARFVHFAPMRVTGPFEKHSYELYGTGQIDTYDEKIRPRETAMSLIRCVAETRNLVGEGPLWDAEGKRLFFTDINGMSVCRLDPQSGSVERWKFHASVSALALTSKTGWLLVATGLQLLLWKVETDERALVLEVEDAKLGNRLNEGAADPEGNFWVGTMRNNVAADGSGIDVDWSLPANRTGSLYRVAPDGAILRQASGLAIPNTMVWSPDRRTMYTGDSIDNVLYAYDYQGGSFSNRRIFTQGFDRGVPDGSAMDEDGFIWNCRYFGHCVVRFDPTGKVDRVVEMPVKNVTSCTFGGDDMRTLFITTASLSGGAGEPLAGGVFALEPGVRGIPANRFRTG
jgi:sugar lactone lactonase YvrE